MVMYRYFLSGETRRLQKLVTQGGEDYMANTTTKKRRTVKKKPAWEAIVWLFPDVAE